MSHADTIIRLYAALDSLDGEGMAACYAPNARFEDPVFGVLTGPRVVGMWRMLTGASNGIDAEVTDVTFDRDRASAHWTARYVFGASGRNVVNRGVARYRFDGELIIDHVDSFSFHRWARQALGPVGLVLGWTPFLRNRVRSGALKNLDRFLADRPGLSTVE